MTADAAREAFAAGYARATLRHPAPLTERATIACEAAARLAESNPQPSAPTLNLGQLEGVWAVIYARREAIEKMHGQALADVLDAVKHLDWGSVIDRLQTELLINPDITGKQLAAELGASIRNMIAADLPATERAAWQTLMTQALIDATAEGQAAALGLIGNTADILIDWNLAATEAKAALSGSQVLWDQASTWIAKQTHGLGYQISQKLAALWDQGATREEMLAAIEEILGATRGTAAVLLDTAVGQAIAQGSLATYQMAGLDYADFVTAGDTRVCPACEDAEQQNPYQLTDVPLPPLHPGCRCAVSPSDFVPSSAALQLVTNYQDVTDLIDVEAA